MVSTAEVMLQAFWTAVLAGAVSMVFARILERRGGIVGGILSGSPVVVIATALGAYYEHSNVRDFQITMLSIPIGMLATAVFLCVWLFGPAKMSDRLSLHRTILVLAVVGLLAWFAVAVPLDVLITTVLQDHFSPAMILASVFSWLAITALGLGLMFKPHPAPVGTNPVSTPMLIFRGALPFLTVFAALALAKENPVLGGIAASFPAVFLSVLVGTCYAQGEAVASGAAGSMVLGMSSAAAYALLAGAAFPLHSIGPWFGTLIVYLTCVLCLSVPSYFYARWRERATWQTRQQAFWTEEEGLVAAGERLPSMTPSQATELHEIRAAAVSEETGPAGAEAKKLPRKAAGAVGRGGLLPLHSRLTIATPSTGRRSSRSIFEMAPSSTDAAAAGSGGGGGGSGGGSSRRV